MRTHVYMVGVCGYGFQEEEVMVSSFSASKERKGLLETSERGDRVKVRGRERKAGKKKEGETRRERQRGRERS